MQKLISIIESLTERIGKVAAWLALVLVLVTGLVVILRYAFQTGSIALQESLLYINALLIGLGAAHTLKHDGHVRVDIFYNRLTPHARAWINLLGTLVLLLPVCLFIVWSSWDYVALSWQIRERSAETSGLPYVYLLKSVILLLAGFLIWQGLSEMLKSLCVVRGEKQ